MKHSRHFAHSQGFTLIELLVVISIISLLISILLPALGSARHSARVMSSNTQLRGNTQGFMAYAQDNKQWLPGMDGNDKAEVRSESHGGPAIGVTAWMYGFQPTYRLGVLLDSDIATPDYMISPAETSADIQAVEDGDRFNFPNHSYALQIIWAGGRRNADNSVDPLPNGASYWPHTTWNMESMSSRQLIMGDRLVAALARNPQNGGDVDSYTTVLSKKAGDYVAGMAWADGHVSVANEPQVDAQFGASVTTFDDVHARGTNPGMTWNIASSQGTGGTGWGVSAALSWRHRHNPMDRVVDP